MRNLTGTSTHQNVVVGGDHMFLAPDDGVDVLRPFFHRREETLEVLPTALERLPDLGQLGEGVAATLKIADQRGPFFGHFAALALGLDSVTLVCLLCYFVGALDEQVQFQLLVLKEAVT